MDATAKSDRDCVSHNVLVRTGVIEERIKAVERISDERDRLYLEKFKSSEIAINAALAAQDKQNAASFLSSEKAIVKAEDAQREYNIRSNEFRGQLDDQAKTLMPRLECQTLFKAYEDKLDDFKKNISEIRETNRETGGRDKVLHIVIGFLVGLVGPAIAVAAMFMRSK